MASEKAIYWTAVMVLALAITNGFVRQYRERVSDLVNCAVTWVEERSEIAADSLKLRDPGRENGDLSQVLRSQVHLARVDCNLPALRSKWSGCVSKGFAAGRWNTNFTRSSILLGEAL